jgi:ribosome-associated protein YbcJ (S4-like RNA binding protein)
VSSPWDDESDPTEYVESIDSRSVPEPTPKPVEEDVVMTDEDVALNATLFLADICDENGKLKEEMVEEAKVKMDDYLKKRKRKHSF